jgi:hypothetical protein
MKSVFIQVMFTAPSLSLTIQFVSQINVKPNSAKPDFCPISGAKIRIVWGTNPQLQHYIYEMFSE